MFTLKTNCQENAYPLLISDVTFHKDKWLSHSIYLYKSKNIEIVTIKIIIQCLLNELVEFHNDAGVEENG